MRDFDWVFVLMVDESDERVEDGDVLLSPVKKLDRFMVVNIYFLPLSKSVAFKWSVKKNRILMWGIVTV